ARALGRDLLQGREERRAVNAGRRRRAGHVGPGPRQPALLGKQRVVEVEEDRLDPVGRGVPQVLAPAPASRSGRASATPGEATVTKPADT
ncbi:MAG: hypothetical protein LC799_29750, partial [Actinobacteria bacterium]|nr:hypothetical protein [Actinomycetota bacterium]